MDMNDQFMTVIETSSLLVGQRLVFYGYQTNSTFTQLFILLYPIHYVYTIPIRPYYINYSKAQPLSLILKLL